MFVSFKIFDKHQQANHLYNYVWLLLVGLTGLTWGLMINTFDNWRRFLIAEKSSIAISLIYGAVIVVAGFSFQSYWVSMSDFTLGSTHSLLSVLYDETLFDPLKKIVGVQNFWVRVDSSCSGIEGMVLSLSIASVFTYLIREDLAFPRCLILLPITCALSLLFNTLRITFLIIIGAEISPTVAVGGFHSIAGWIGSVLIAFLIVFVFSSWTYIQKGKKMADQPLIKDVDGDIALAILIPFVVFSAVTLVGGLFGDGFDYYYPIKVIFTTGAVAYYWRTYHLGFPDKLGISIMVGVLVALLWIALIPPNIEWNAKFSQAITSMNSQEVFVWTLFRMLGFLITAPILEELVFRGYLIDRISLRNISIHDTPKFSSLALVVSSCLFGALHSYWIPGILAGLLFALLRFGSQSIVNCIIAHSIANLVVALWVHYSGNWSLL